MNITFTFYSKIALFTFHPYPDRPFRYGGQIALYNPKGLVSICFKVSPDQQTAKKLKKVKLVRAALFNLPV